MAKINVKRRLRPIRFAFLVPPNDMSELLRVFQINTVLWGGRHNIVVPAWRRSPSTGTAMGTGSGIVRSLLDAAEPDFVVAGSVDPSRYDIPAERVVSLNDLLADPILPRAGLSTMPLYHALYREHFRYVTRHPQRFFYSTGNSTFPAFCAARFGEVPGGPWQTHVAALNDLGATGVAVTKDTYGADLFRASSAFALGSQNLEVLCVHRTAYMVIDPTRFHDLVDYWNLRAFGWQVFPIPVPWAGDLTRVLANLLDTEHAPRPPTRLDITAAHLTKAHSVHPPVFERIAEALATSSDQVIVQRRVPRYWDRQHWREDLVERPELLALNDEVEVAEEEGAISFATLPPSFSTQHIASSTAQWANVLHVQAWGNSEVAEVVPSGLHSIGNTLSRGWERENYRCTTEGIVKLDHWKGRRLFWKLPNGVDVLQHWLSSKISCEVAISTAGRMTQQMLRVLGGPERTLVACSPSMIKLFGIAASSGSRSMRFDRFWGALLKELRNDRERATGLVEHWSKSGIVDLGFEIACTQCGQMNWYAMNAIDRTLKCDRCLDDFPYPVAQPGKAAWAIRPLGAFAVDGRAQGAFSVALTLRALRLCGLHARTTWATGVLVTREDKSIQELDIAILRQEDGPFVSPVDALFVECKTFGRFEAKDVSRMRQFSADFPGAFLVFATLNTKLATEELRMLRRLAVSGRKRWRNPLIAYSGGLEHSFRQHLSSHSAPLERFRSAATGV
jgi:hypothetical protein